MAKRGVVLLLHGIRSDRRSMIGRARLLFRAGYSVLLIDLQAHGESTGERITFGYLETESVVAAIKYARAKWPNERLAIIGTSLGGAAAVFAAKQQRADVYILEAVYSSLRDATENRLKLSWVILGRCWHRFCSGKQHCNSTSILTNYHLLIR
ncbi:MAG: alpha/beta hydrolase [Hyphomicrobiales bacterium]|nr:alpha/beta hydrolase [Hyphomicrobiales bacterium]